MTVDLDHPDDKFMGATTGMGVMTMYGTGFESMGQGHNAGIAWMEVGKYIEQMLATDPKLSFEYGRAMVMTEHSTDPRQEYFHQWWRGNGLLLLADDRTRTYLVTHLAQEASVSLAQKLQDFIGRDVSLPRLPRDKDDLTNFPEDFLTFVTVALGLGLEGASPNPSILQLVQAAKAKLTDEAFLTVVGLYDQIKDCKTVSQFILSHK